MAAGTVCGLLAARDHASGAADGAGGASGRRSSRASRLPDSPCSSSSTLPRLQARCERDFERVLLVPAADRAVFGDDPLELAVIRIVLSAHLDAAAGAGEVARLLGGRADLLLRRAARRRPAPARLPWPSCPAICGRTTATTTNPIKASAATTSKPTRMFSFPRCFIRRCAPRRA